MEYAPFQYDPPNLGDIVDKFLFHCQASGPQFRRLDICGLAADGGPGRVRPTTSAVFKGGSFINPIEGLDASGSRWEGTSWKGRRRCYSENTKTLW